MISDGEERITLNLSMGDDPTLFNAGLSENGEEMPLDLDETTELGGTDDFNWLRNRPKYNGETMTSETDIPNLSVDEAISATSKNPVENRVIAEELGKKTDVSKLAKVATSGKYEDLEGEPTEFTQAEWERLWVVY